MSLETGIPVRNAWLMLLYAHELARFGGRFRARAESAPNLVSLLATVLCDSVEPLVRRHLGRDFVRRDETITGVRGRLQVTASLPHLARRTGRTVCRVRRRTVDTLRNRILRATLRRLLHDPEIDRGEVRPRVHALVHALHGVADVRLEASAFSRVQLGRSDTAWELPLGVCAMLYRLQAPSEEAGHHSTTSLLRDEIVFHELFERFVRNFFMVHHPTWRHPSRQLHWWETSSPGGPPTRHRLLPTMQADVVLHHPGPPARRIVLDTKFYRRTLQQNRFGTERFRNEHLYQLYAYLRTQEHLGPAHRTAEGVLLYPTVQHDLDERLWIQDRRFRVMTLDLSLPWPAIAARLHSVVAPASRVDAPTP